MNLSVRVRTGTGDLAHDPGGRLKRLAIAKKRGNEMNEEPKHVDAERGSENEGNDQPMCNEVYHVLALQNASCASSMCLCGSSANGCLSSVKHHQKTYFYLARSPLKTVAAKFEPP
jgi:hypothetical protein